METKSANQVKHFYTTNKHKLGLSAPDSGKGEKDDDEPEAKKPKKPLAASLTSPPPSASEKDGKVMPCTLW